MAHQSNAMQAYVTRYEPEPEQQKQPTVTKKVIKKTK